MSKPTEIEENLLAKYFEGHATTQDLQQLGAWLEADTGNTLELDKYRKLWDLKPKAMQIFEPDINLAWNKVQKRIERKAVPKTINKNIYLRNFSFAASVALLVGFGVYFYFFKEKTTIYQTVIAQNNSVNQVLADSSKVFLNLNSSLEFPDQYAKNERRVKLKGEAFFDIKPNPDKPFNIEVGMLNIKVLGTSFNVKEDTLAIEVIVKTGRVIVAKSANDSEILIAGEAVVYDKKKKTFNKKHSADPNEFAYYNKVFSFKNASLVQVTSTLSKGYNAKISIGNQDINNLSITTKFENESLSNALQIIAETLQLRLEVENNEYVFVRK